MRTASYSSHTGVTIPPNILHVYPTYSIAGMQASAAIRVERFLNGTTGRIVRGLARLMR